MPAHIGARRAINLGAFSPGAGGGVVPALQLATHRGEIDTITTGSATTSANVLRVHRARHTIPAGGAFSSLVVSTGAWAAAADTDNGEVNTPAFALRCHVECNGVAVIALFGGVDGKAVASGDADVQTDPFLPSSFGLTEFVPGTTFWVAIETQFAVGAIPYYTSANSAGITGEAAFIAAAGSVSKIGVAGAMSTANGYTAFQGYKGHLVLGLPKGKTPVLVTVGTSIESRKFDDFGDGVNLKGGYARVAAAAGSMPTAHLNLACSGESAAAFRANGTKRRALFKYAGPAGIGYVGHGVNDNARQSPAATASADCVWIHQQMRSAGLKYTMQTNVLPKTVTTDSGATTANQTVFSNSLGPFTTWRDAFRAANQNAVPGTINAIVDVAAAVETTSNSGIWQTNKASDGLHPNGTSQTNNTHRLDLAPVLQVALAAALAAT